MTDNLEEKNNPVLDKRMERRKMLKLGALAAPVALTLHGGVALAHANSAGNCAFNLVEIANNLNDERSKYLTVPVKGNQIAPAVNNNFIHAPILDPEHYENGTQLRQFDGSALHWQFIGDPANNRYGLSCANSVVIYIKEHCNNGHGNLDQCAPGNSFLHNAAENDVFGQGGTTGNENPN